MGKQRQGEEQERDGANGLTESTLKTVVAEAYERGGEANTVILCADTTCRGVLAGVVESLWCTRCGKEHRA